MIKFFIMLLLLNLLLLGDVNIDMQINRIKNAPAAQRVKLMNAFKLRVSQMNYEDRSSAIREIQAKMRIKSQARISLARESKMREIKEHASQMQAQNSDDIASYQNMNQQQIKNSIAHDKIERKEGVISKIKIVNQILKQEREEQDIRLPNQDRIKQNQKIKIELLKQLEKNKEIRLQKIEPQIKPVQQIQKIEQQREPQTETVQQMQMQPEIEVPNNQIEQSQQINSNYIDKN